MDYFDLKALEKQQVQEQPSGIPISIYKPVDHKISDEKDTLPVSEEKSILMPRDWE